VEIQALQTYIPVWREVFKEASTAKKKMKLSTINECVRVYRESVEIKLKINIDSFLSTAGVNNIVGTKAKNDDPSKILSHKTKINQE
jgi:hypothetical protein